MKHLSIIAALAILVASCSAPEETGQLADLKTKRDSLKTVKAELSIELKALEDKIKMMDTANLKLPLVTTMAIVPSDFKHYVKVQGILETDKNAQIFPEAPGKITSIKVKEGDKVSKGQTLITLDSKVVRTQIADLQGQMELAETLYKKQDKLWKQNIGSEVQFLQAKNNFNSMMNKMGTLQAQLAMYTITAPFAGVVDEVMPKVGEAASPAMPVARIVNTQAFYIKSDISEDYLGKIEEGDDVMIRIGSIDEEMTTKITRIGKYINPNNRSFSFRVNLDNDGGNLRPNMLAEIMVADYEKDSVIVIPSTLIQQTPDGSEFVYTIDDSGEYAKAVKTSITSGKDYKDKTYITEGLDPSMVIIDKGARAIKDGQLIKVVSE